MVKSIFSLILFLAASVSFANLPSGQMSVEEQEAVVAQDLQTIQVAGKPAPDYLDCFFKCGGKQEKDGELDILNLENNCYISCRINQGR